MASISIQMSPHDETPRVHFGDLSGCSRFAYCYLGDEITLHFPGYDHEVLAAMRALAEALAKGIEELSAALPAEPPPPAVEPFTPPPPDAPEQVVPSDDEVIF